MNKDNLKVAVRGAYDLQKLRIQVGNRIAANFKAKLGQKPGEPEEDMEKEAKKILTDLRIRFKRITDGIATFPRSANFQGDEVISTYTELCLCASYFDLERDEKTHFARLEKMLQDFPIYTQWLVNVRGVGPALAGIIISEIDIHKAKYPSSLHAYCGIDVVSWFELKERFSDEAPERLRKRHPEGYTTKGPAVVTETEWFGLYSEEGELLGHYGLPPKDTLGFGAGRSRRSEHLVEVKYVDSDGNEAIRKGLSFKPFIKTKLLGVLGSSFLRAGANDNPYREIYDTYRARLETMPQHAEKTKMHKHRMATRFMIKQFLTDLYAVWRKLEGLPVSKPYEVEKLRKSA